MICKKYEQHGLGQLNEEQFREHLAICSQCQALVREDNKIMAMAEKVNQNLIIPDLWPDIERALLHKKKVKVYPLYRNWILRVAAVLILAVSLTLYLSNREESTHTMILSQAALQKVEKTERDHMNAINQLEQAAREQLSQIDVEIASLYRTKIETIDAQIERCKAALEENPANTHIRKYLLAALIDKKETLNELIIYAEQEVE